MESLKNFLKDKLKKIRFIRYFVIKYKIFIFKYFGIKKGKNNKIINKGIMINHKFNIIGNNNYIFIGRDAIFKNTLIFIRGNNHKLIIEDNCNYGGGYLWFEDNNCKIHIKQKTSIQSAELSVCEPNSEINIGSNCLFSGEIVFRTSDSHSIIDNSTEKRINYAKNITVGEHVWIGSRATILKGVSLANNSVIASNSIVTKSFYQNNIIIAGNPAKIIKENINWNHDRTYDK